MWCLSIDIGKVRKITFSLSLCLVVKEYGITIRLHPGCHNVSGRCWMWLSGSWVCYATMALHWLLRTKKQNDARYNKCNHRCCKPCLCLVPISLQCSRPYGGHRSCSAWSCIFSTQLQNSRCDPSRNLASLCRTRPCLPHRRKGTWCREYTHGWSVFFSSGFQPDFGRNHQYLADRSSWCGFLSEVLQSFTTWP